MSTRSIIIYDDSIPVHHDTFVSGHRVFHKKRGAWISPWYFINVKTKNALSTSSRSLKKYTQFPRDGWGQLLRGIRLHGVKAPIVCVELERDHFFWRRYSKKLHEPDMEIDEDFRWMIDYGRQFLPDGYSDETPYFCSIDGRHRVVCCRYLRLMVPSIIYKEDYERAV